MSGCSRVASALCSSQSSIGGSNHSSQQPCASIQRENNSRLVAADSVARICDLVDQCASDFNAVNVSTAFHRMARLWNSPITDSRDVQLRQRVDLCIRQLGDLALVHLRSFQGQGLGIVVWSLAKINIDGEHIRHILQVFAEEAASRLEPGFGGNASLHLGAQSLSNMLYAYALLNFHPGTALLSAIARGVQWQLRKFSPQGLSNTVWSVAKLGADMTTDLEELLRALAVEAVSQLADESARANFIPQNLSNMLYGFAQLNVQPGSALTEAVGNEALRQLHNFGPQELTNITWALAKLLGPEPKGPQVQAFLAAVPSTAQFHLSNEVSARKVKSQTLSNLLYAFAVMEMHPGTDFMVTISLAIQRQVTAFKAQELASTLWALAKLRHHPGQHLMAMAVRETCRQLDKFKAHDLAMALHALAVLGSTVESDVARVATRSVSARSDVLPAEALVSLLWALAVCDQLRGEGIATLLAKATNQQPASQYSTANLRHLIQIRAAYPDVSAFEASVPPELLDRMNQAAIAAQQEAVSEKDMVGSEVSSLLTSLGIPHTRRLPPVASLPATIDIAVPHHRIALQLDGPACFFSTPPLLPLGETLLQWRILLQEGWKVVSLPSYAWKQAISQGRQQEYLLQLLSGSYRLPFNQEAGLAPLMAVLRRHGSNNSPTASADSYGGQLQQLCLQPQPVPDTSSGEASAQDTSALWHGSQHVLRQTARQPVRLTQQQRVATGNTPLPSCSEAVRWHGFPMQQQYYQQHQAAQQRLPGGHILPPAAGNGAFPLLGTGAAGASGTATPELSFLPPIAATASDLRQGSNESLLGICQEPPCIQAPQPPVLGGGQAFPMGGSREGLIAASTSAAAVKEAYGARVSGLINYMQQQQQLQWQMPLQSGSSGSVATNSMACSSRGTVWLQDMARRDTMSSQMSSSLADETMRLQTASVFSEGSEEAARQSLRRQAGGPPGWAAQTGSVGAAPFAAARSTSGAARPGDGALPLNKFSSISMGHASLKGVSVRGSDLSGAQCECPQGAPVFSSHSGGAWSSRVHIAEPASNSTGSLPEVTTPFLAARTPLIRGARDANGRASAPRLKANSDDQTTSLGLPAAALPAINSASATSTSRVMSRSSISSTTIAGMPAGSQRGLLTDSGSFGGGDAPAVPSPDLCRLLNVTSKSGTPHVSAAEQDLSHIAQLKHALEQLPLEESAVACFAACLARLTPSHFTLLLKELAHGNAFRAWQLFDWVRKLPREHPLAHLCGSEAFCTMIALCGPWQQLPRALQLVADMQASGIECDMQAQTALLGSAVKCGETHLAAKVYRQMSASGSQLPTMAFVIALQVFLKLGSWQEAIGVLDDMALQGMPADVQTYNLVISSCMKLGKTEGAVKVYKRMWEGGVVPTTKTFVLLIDAFAEGGEALDVIMQAIAAEWQRSKEHTTYAAVMAACEKAGRWQLAVKLFRQITDMGITAEVAILNSIVAACAHSGEHAQARAIFDAMPSHGCQPDAVTFANLIRAYKKGGQWCQTVATLEAMQTAGAVPHAAVVSSVIDALWHTGVVWAQLRAAKLFRDAISCGQLAGAAELAKKGTLKVDLQALTVGAALLAMHQWLATVRSTAGPSRLLELNKKVMVLNGMGEHSRAQGSSAVKEAIGASLKGAGAPFRLAVDHQRCSRLEASTQPLAEWLLSDDWLTYSDAFDPGVDHGHQAALSTTEYLAVEAEQAATADQMFEAVRQFEAKRGPALQGLVATRAVQLLRRQHLVAAILSGAASLLLSDQVAHQAVALMDSTMAAGGDVSPALEPVFTAACLHTAAAASGTVLPSDSVAALFGSTGHAVEVVERDISNILDNGVACVSPLHVLHLFVQRLGCQLSSPKLVLQTAGPSFRLMGEVVADATMLQWPPSIMAAAVLISCRRRQGCVPAWPSVLGALTGYTEGATCSLSAAVTFCDRLLSLIYQHQAAPCMRF